MSSLKQMPPRSAPFEQEGEFAVAIELRRRFPGITGNEQTREQVRTIAGDRGLTTPNLATVPADLSFRSVAAVCFR
jgi:hypothetical protein